MEKKPIKLLDQVSDDIRVKHYSLRTEESYGYRDKRFILFDHQRQPREMNRVEITAFHTHLAVTEKVAATSGAGKRGPAPPGRRRLAGPG